MRGGHGWRRAFGAATGAALMPIALVVVVLLLGVIGGGLVGVPGFPQPFDGPGVALDGVVPTPEPLPGAIVPVADDGTVERSRDRSVDRRPGNDDPQRTRRNDGRRTPPHRPTRPGSGGVPGADDKPGTPSPTGPASTPPPSASAPKPTSPPATVTPPAPTSTPAPAPTTAPPASGRPGVVGSLTDGVEQVVAPLPVVGPVVGGVVGGVVDGVQAGPLGPLLP